MQYPRVTRRPWTIAAAAAVLLAAGLTPLPAQPLFTDATTEAGLGYLQHHAAEPPDCLLGETGGYCVPERMSGGAAAGDADGDGWVDLYVTRLDGADLLFINQRDGTFRDTSVESGLASFELQSNGAVFVDIDNDGDLDLFVTTIGRRGDPVNSRYYLFVNDGAGHFSEDARRRGVALETGRAHGGFSATCGDFDRDGWLDLHVTEWLPESFGGPGLSHNRLLRNRGASQPGHFDDVTEAAGVSLDPASGCASGAPCGTWAFASAFVDLDADGWPELVVAADFGTGRLFWNQGDGTFTDGTRSAGVGTDKNGMGSTFGDFDGDGDLDWFVTAIQDPAETCDPGPCTGGNRLYRNEGGRQFSDATDWAGVRGGYWGWGAVFFDAENDGDLDLVMTNGIDFPTSRMGDRWTDDPMRFWTNDGDGRMSEATQAAGLTDTASGKGLLTLDYDRDGDLDVFIVNNAGAPRLYRNDASSAFGWLRVDVRGEVSNRSGIGTRVTVEATPGARPQVREVGVASHFLGQSETAAHFGLGEGGEPVWRVVVEWPRSGRRQVFRDVPRNTVLDVDESLSTDPRQVPGDANQDGVLNLSDAVSFLGFLFTGAPSRLPCGDGTLTQGGNTRLLDWQGDGVLDISDGIAPLHFLFGSGPPHPLAVHGEETRGCVPIAGCAENTTCP